MFFLLFILFITIPLQATVMGRKTKALEALVLLTGNSKQACTFTALKPGDFPAIYKMSTQDEHFVVRFTDCNWSFTRAAEAAIQQYASEHGFGPKLYYQDYKEGILIMQCLEQHYMENDFRFSTENRQYLVDLLKKIHSVKDINQPIHRYADGVIMRLHNLRINPDNIDLVYIINMLKFLKPLLNVAADDVTIHGDLHIPNIFFQTDHYKIIDFEGVRVDSFYIDVATVAIYNCINREQELELLTLYLNQEPRYIEYLKFIAAKCFSLAVYATWMFERIDKSKLIEFKPVPYFNEIVLQWPKLDFSKDEVLYWVGSSMFKEIERLLEVLQKEFLIKA